MNILGIHILTRKLQAKHLFKEKKNNIKNTASLSCFSYFKSPLFYFGFNGNQTFDINDSYKSIAFIAHRQHWFLSLNNRCGVVFVVLSCNQLCGICIVTVVGNGNMGQKLWVCFLEVYRKNFKIQETMFSDCVSIFLLLVLPFTGIGK